jgi:hypothetical protein
MRNLRNSILNKRIPQSMGILVLVFSLGTIFWLSGNAILFGTKAAVGNIPKDIQVSNIDNTSFTVSYVTDSEVNGSISYGTDQKLGRVAFDKRDISTPLPHGIHYLTVSKLSPSTKYYFSIISGDKTFNDNSSPFEVTTASAAAKNTAEDKISGLATLDGGNTPSEAIAYLKSDKSQLLSSLVQPDGTYSILLNKMLKNDLSGYLDLAPETILKMRLVNQTLESSISLLAGQAKTIPPITLSKNYDFSISDSPLSGSSASDSANVNQFPSVETSTTAQSIQILTPNNSEEFKDTQPQFSGKALPGKDVEITINSTDEITTTVQADQNGDWEYRPDTSLSSGTHTITIKTEDSEGAIKTLTRSFTVLAAGSQFVEPSISPTDAPTPTEAQPTKAPLSPTSVPTTAPTLAPTIAPTEIPTISQTPLIVVTPISTPSGTPVPQITTPPIPNSGSSAFVFGAFGISAIIGIGSLLFFLL